jgi:predicted helicase
MIKFDYLKSINGSYSLIYEHKIGNYSAIELILDQHKEKKLSNPVTAEKFNTYRFIDYIDKVIDIIKRITTVSLETMKIINQMENENNN